MSNNIKNYYSMEMMNDDVAMMQTAENSFTNNNPQVSGFNGRVFFLPNESSKPDNLYGGQQGPQELDDSSINNTLTSNPLSQAYFNVYNQNLIQVRIIEEIKKISNGEYMIGRQNDGELQIIMRSFYLQFGKNIDNDIASQVEELNKMVVDECIRIIVPNIQQYLGYRRDISNPIPVLPRSQNVSNKGRNTFSLLVV